MEAPRGVGWGVGRGCPPPYRGRGLGRGLCPLPRNFFEFVSENGEFWCILGGILAGVCSYKRVKR